MMEGHSDIISHKTSEDNNYDKEEEEEGDLQVETSNRPAEQDEQEENGHEDEEHDGDEDESEFSFVCCGETNSPISADDIFEDGQIRPLFHFVVQHDSSSDSDHRNDDHTAARSPIKKVFIKRSDLTTEVSEGEKIIVADGPYCEWTEKENEKDSNDHHHQSSFSSSSPPPPETCKKSNSTGFSKLCRFRDMFLRSHSDGKDAFVFLANQHHHKREEDKQQETTTSSSSEKDKVSAKNKKKVVVAPEKVTAPKNGTTSYWKKKKNGGVLEVRRKTYLPYRQDLVGFFTTVNGMSRNVHPY